MKIAIIGGTGKMGRWLAEFLLKDGKQVVITGRDHVKLEKVGRELGLPVASIHDAARTADIIVLSVPIDSREAVAKEISAHLKPSQLIIDISSVKAAPLDLMHRHLPNATVLGAHPLFGPGAGSLNGQNVVLTPTSAIEQAQARRVEDYLKKKGAKVIFMTPQEHDETMSAVLGLSHFVALTTADALLSTGKLKSMLEVSGTTFRLLMTLVESVLSEDPVLYASLQTDLPVEGIEAAFLERAAQWASLVKEKDKQGFARRMAALRSEFEKVDPDFGGAYRRMYRINEAGQAPD